ncbi:DUF551 domain-containing protein [Escherichia coli]|nr:DUF551 domain-containing protein [Escherichia coli]EJN4389110.1 DUF551 domain-containing protein [Escherichia coli]EJN4493984.1 DUF551 domain-containing protein [Escherichia coli]EJN4508149.1 DUF551 domain-containing protein [Escherichia coli]EJP0100680.1 DUF551 domain-containing protein [Escherichia coli]
MAEFTKEQLIEKLERRLAVTTHYPDFEEAQLDAQIFKIALEALTAGMEQEPVAWLLSGGGAKNNVSFDSGNAYADPLREVTPLYTAPPAPVSVPAAMEIDDDFDSAFEHGKAVGWNAYRAAMLQAEPVSNSDELPLDYLQGHKDGLEWAAQQAEANHPQTGDWLYDDPIELARAIRKGPDIPEFKSVSVDEDDNFYSWFGRFWYENYQKNNYTTSAKQMLGTMAEFAYRAGRESAALAGNSPVIPDGWISCSERMPNDAQWCVVNTKYGYYVQCWSEGQGWLGDDISIPECDVINWMPLPEPPQEVNRG